MKDDQNKRTGSIIDEKNETFTLDMSFLFSLPFCFVHIVKMNGSDSIMEELL